PLLDSASEEEIAVLVAATKDNPLRIAVDPTEQAAGIAAMTLVDMLRIEGIEARVVENRMTSIVEESLPEGEVDAVISTADTSVTATNVASFFTCHADEKTAAAAASTTAAPTSAEPAPTKSESPASTQQKLWSGNLSLRSEEHTSELQSRFD